MLGVKSDQPAFGQATLTVCAITRIHVDRPAEVDFQVEGWHGQNLLAAKRHGPVKVVEIFDIAVEGRRRDVLKVDHIRIALL
jgi:hypothetical protein